VRNNSISGISTSTHIPLFRATPQLGHLDSLSTRSEELRRSCPLQTPIHQVRDQELKLPIPKMRNSTLRTFLPSYPKSCIHVQEERGAKLIPQMGSLYPLCPTHRSSHHVLLPPNQADKSSPRNCYLHLCGYGCRTYYPSFPRPCDQRDASESKVVDCVRADWNRADDSLSNIPSSLICYYRQSS
jgi:hypothetical protein